MKDYYKILGVEHKASKEQIKKAYQDLALKNHPDKNRNEGATQIFQELNEAYETLSDSQKKRGL